MKCKAPYALLEAVVNANTVEEAAGIIRRQGPPDFFDRLSQMITEKASSRTGEAVRVGTVIFSYEESILGMCSQAANIIESSWR